MSTFQFAPAQEQEVLEKEQVLPEHQIVLYNDDVNTFDSVIESLMDICSHERLQAEQCSLIVHYNGRCAVKDGEIGKLKPLCEALLDRGLSAVIE